ncbi:MAG: putative DNA binding domain-containing protein [bacterium]|nr:putative DNA binding domain-containing protein [bacterium]
MVAFPIPGEVSNALERIDHGESPGDLESETLEFKSGRGGPRKTLTALVEAAACLANSQGGTVVAGAENDVSGIDAYTGTDLDILEVLRYIFDTASPRLTVSVAEHRHREARLLVISVPMGAAVHGVSGRVTRRIGRHCMPLSPSEVANLHIERSGLDPSEVGSGRSVDEADQEALGLLRRHLRSLRDERVRWAELTDAELCGALGLASADGEMLVAGEQLVCAGTNEVVAYQHRTSSGSPPDASERFTTPLIVAFDRTLDRVAARNRSEPLLLPNGQQLLLENHPTAAVREALANACVHRRLDQSEPIVVEHFDDSLSITSSGPLVSGVTVQNILVTSSRPRNRLLAKTFRSLGLIEELGTGIARMYRSMLQVGKAPPTFDATGDAVRVSLEGGPAGMAFALFVASLPDGLSNDVETLMVLRHLCSASSARPSDIAPLIQRPPIEAHRILERIAAEKTVLIEKVDSARKGLTSRYRLAGATVPELGSAVAWRRSTSSRIDAVVTGYVLEHGQVTNRIVRELCRVGAPRASAILRNLTDRGLLARNSEASRGPGVAYGPGASLEQLAPTRRVDPRADANSSVRDS